MVETLPPANDTAADIVATRTGAAAQAAGASPQSGAPAPVPAERARCFADVSILYRSLLHQYYEDRRLHDAEGNAQLRKWLRDPRLILTEGRASVFPEARRYRTMPDYFGAKVVHAGGMRTLDSFRELDVRTLAALTAWNDINLARIEQIFVIRRWTTGLIAATAAAGTIAKLFGATLSAGDAWHVMVRFGLAWQLPFFLAGVLIIAFLETEVLSRNRDRLKEFRELLTIAQAWRPAVRNNDEDV